MQKENYKKPRLGSTVYCIYDDCLLKLKVYAKGTDTFITDNFCDSGSMLDCLEWDYSTYNIWWFTNFTLAKKEIMKQYKIHHPEEWNDEELGVPRLVKEYDDYWEIH